ncbi:hypothetical protein [Tissierella sp. Yu-01]|uniref:hypothetical protein n=1 Tax=Tissierella sp. Yu-01 TaxID=3035694 RepID=UPI00240E4D6F|nr:hypothetical protein [Tissierella sp. Yu-01]WFA10378.1 hypothetical protein P3962_07440 [Tissierella sp. Yu-01]
MTDRELLELIAAQVGNLTTNVESIKKDLVELKEGQNRIENKLDDIEANNADRHVVINTDLSKLRATISKVEIVTADNWSDIARLKAHRRKIK